MRHYAQKALAVILVIIILTGMASCQDAVIPSSPGTSGFSSAPPAETGNSGALDTGGSTDDPGGTGSNSNGPTTSPSPISPGQSAPDLKPEPIPVKSVEVILGSEEVARGTVLEPAVNILPADADDKIFELSSSDENVLRLVDGRWTAAGAGTAELIATAGNSITGSATVTVIVPVEGFSLGDAEILLNRGDSIKLDPAITPADATDRRVYYTSSDENLARVSEDGTIWGVGAGTAVIEGTAGGFRDKCTVTVAIPVTGVSVSTNKRIYKVGDQGSFTIRIEPQDASDKSYNVSVGGAAAVLTGDNTFSCEEGGEATVTATAANGATGKQAITVIDLEAYAAEVLRLTNIERDSKGLAPLSETPALTQTAIVRANETIKSFSHERPDGRSCFTAFDENGVTYFWAGENIAAGQKTPAEVVRAWMDSPGHRENILSGEFGHLGVGVAMDSNGRLYWSQNFTD